MEQTRLEKLVIGEVSGVDDPANQLPGFMVTKSVDAPTRLAKIKAIVLGDAPQQEGLDMDRDELVALLDEREDALVEKVAEALVAKSAPAEGEGATETVATPEAAVPPAEEVAPAITAEDVAKAVEEGVEALRADMTAVFEAMIERNVKIEKALGIVARTSVEGQDDGPDGATETTEKSAPDLADAIAQALPSRA